MSCRHTETPFVACFLGGNTLWRAFISNPMRNPLQMPVRSCSFRDGCRVASSSSSSLQCFPMWSDGESLASLGRCGARPGHEDAGKANAAGMWSGSDQEGGSEAAAAAGEPKAGLTAVGAGAPMSRRQRQLESAARAREARKRRRLVQFAKVPEDTRSSKEEIAALHSMFSRGPSSAERERTRALHVERKWLARAVRVAADSCISMETEGLVDLLRDVERSRDQKLLQPGNFVLCRMYDESPFTMRTDTLSEGGHSEGCPTWHGSKALQAAVAGVAAERQAWPPGGTAHSGHRYGPEQPPQTANNGQYGS